MKKWYRFILVGLFSFNIYCADSQPSCTIPVSPVLTRVSVQPETGITELNWALSPSSDIAAYIVYKYKDGDGMAIDTLWDPGITSFSYNTPESKYYSLSYVVAAFRMPVCVSPLSNPISTIFCSSEIDTCRKLISVRWNLYSDYPEHVLKYEINVTKDDASLPETYSVNSQTDSLILTGFDVYTRYCFVVKAILEGGVVSSSNKSCLTTKMLRPPQWINADYSTVTSENRISLSYTIDPLSEIRTFILERKIGYSGTFKQIADISSEDGRVTYTDNQADINDINFYRLSAINNCKIPVAVSNLSSNIVLSSDRIGNDINLTWTAYKSWLGELSGYKVLIKTGEGFREIALLQPYDTVYSIGYSDIMYQVTGSEVCFIITAQEAGNPHGITGESRSAEKCTSLSENITVPNLFTPDGDLINDLFKPVLSFIPENYQLVISDRNGRIVFETRNYSDEWDGSVSGSQLPQGVYLWFLKVKVPSGKMISKTGTITIVRNR